MPRPCNEEESICSNTESHDKYIGRLPVLTSARGGHHHQISYHRDGFRAYPHHPYARPNNAQGTVATSFFGDPSHRPYGYEYCGDNKQYADPINNFPMHHQGHQVYQVGQSRISEPLPPSEMKGVMNLSYQATSQNKKDETKKPPRPYTEYNIFFQLERERILGELEEEQRKKQGEDTESIEKDMSDAKLNTEMVDSVDIKKKETEITVDVVTSPNDPDDEEKCCPRYTTPSSPGVILNHPSDSNDVLPRPARFAHLQLAPLWYDSTHRLALSKVNKSRRRHRKTHGLVGFLDLTKRISKAWAEADAPTKEYCKRVADRQLQIYKEELKLWKTRLDVPSEDVGCEYGEGNVSQPESCTSGTNLQQNMKMQNMLREQEKTSDSGDANVHPNISMPPPPPPHPLAMCTSATSAHHSVNHRYNEYWQHQQALYQRQGPPYLHPIYPQHQVAGQSSRQYYAPVIPSLTPDSDNRGGQIAGLHGGVSEMNHTPLDELMHRRKLYGSRVSTDQNPQKYRSPGTSRQERTSSKGSSRNNDAGTEVDNMPKKARKQSKANAKLEKSYLSPPEIAERSSPSSTVAVTPSPSRRHASSQSKSEENTGLDAALGAAGRSNGKESLNLSPNSESPGSSVVYAISPSCMMTPGSSPLSEGQHAFDGSYLNGGVGEGDFGSSPFPYIDWGSPHDRSPQYGRRKGHPNGTPPQETYQGENQCSIPSHLAVPGANGVSWNPHGSQWTGSHYSVQYQSPGSSHFASMMPPPSPYPIVDGNAGELDLDEEEMHLLWRRLATHASRKRIRERDAAAAWVYHHHGPASSFSSSPGGEGRFENPMGGNFRMVHSFSSPMERPETRKTSTRPSDDDNTDSGFMSNINSRKHDTKQAKGLPSLQDAI